MQIPREAANQDWIVIDAATFAAYENRAGTTHSWSPSSFAGQISAQPYASGPPGEQSYSPGYPDVLTDDATVPRLRLPFLANGNGGEYIVYVHASNGPDGHGRGINLGLNGTPVYILGYGNVPNTVGWDHQASAPGFNVAPNAINYLLVWPRFNEVIFDRMVIVRTGATINGLEISPTNNPDIFNGPASELIEEPTLGLPSTYSSIENPDGQLVELNATLAIGHVSGLVGGVFAQLKNTFGGLLTLNQDGTITNDSPGELDYQIEVYAGDPPWLPLMGTSAGVGGLGTASANTPIYADATFQGTTTGVDLTGITDLGVVLTGAFGETAFLPATVTGAGSFEFDFPASKAGLGLGPDLALQLVQGTAISSVILAEGLYTSQERPGGQLIVPTTVGVGQLDGLVEDDDEGSSQLIYSQVEVHSLPTDMAVSANGVPTYSGAADITLHFSGLENGNWVPLSQTFAGTDNAQNNLAINHSIRGAASNHSDPRTTVIPAGELERDSSGSVRSREQQELHSVLEQIIGFVDPASNLIGARTRLTDLNEFDFVSPFATNGEFLLMFEHQANDDVVIALRQNDNRINSNVPLQLTMPLMALDVAELVGNKTTEDWRLIIDGLTVFSGQTFAQIPPSSVTNVGTLVRPGNTNAARYDQLESIGLSIMPPPADTEPPVFTTDQPGLVVGPNFSIAIDTGITDNVGYTAGVEVNGSADPTTWPNGVSFDGTTLTGVGVAPGEHAYQRVADDGTNVTRDDVTPLVVVAPLINSNPSGSVIWAADAAPVIDYAGVFNLVATGADIEVIQGPPHTRTGDTFQFDLAGLEGQSGTIIVEAFTPHGNTKRDFLSWQVTQSPAAVSITPIQHEHSAQAVSDAVGGGEGVLLDPAPMGNEQFLETSSANATAGSDVSPAEHVTAVGTAASVVHSTQAGGRTSHQNISSSVGVVEGAITSAADAAHETSTGQPAILENTAPKALDAGHEQSARAARAQTDSQLAIRDVLNAYLGDKATALLRLALNPLPAAHAQSIEETLAEAVALLRIGVVTHVHRADVVQGVGILVLERGAKHVQAIGSARNQENIGALIISDLTHEHALSMLTEFTEGSAAFGGAVVHAQFIRAATPGGALEVELTDTPLVPPGTVIVIR